MLLLPQITGNNHQTCFFLSGNNGTYKMLLLLQFRRYNPQTWSQEPLTQVSYRVFSDRGQRSAKGH